MRGGRGYAFSVRYNCQGAVRRTYLILDTDSDRSVLQFCVECVESLQLCGEAFQLYVALFVCQNPKKSRKQGCKPRKAAVDLVLLLHLQLLRRLVGVDALAVEEELHVVGLDTFARGVGVEDLEHLSRPLHLEERHLASLKKRMRGGAKERSDESKTACEASPLLLPEPDLYGAAGAGRRTNLILDTNCERHGSLVQLRRVVLCPVSLGRGGFTAAPRPDMPLLSLTHTAIAPGRGRCLVRRWRHQGRHERREKSTKHGGPWFGAGGCARNLDLMKGRPSQD